jgi:hemerythrin superfamily protein
MPDGIDLILADHRTVDDLFAEFDSTREATVIGQVIDALRAHDDAEQAALYPLAAELLGDAKLLERSGRAHAAVKQHIDHLKAQEGPSLTVAFATLRELVEDHVADEEKHLLPALQEAASQQQLDELGARILQAKQRGG